MNITWWHRFSAPTGSGISTDSARGPETTGNNRHVSDNADTRWDDPTPEPGRPPPGYTIGISQVRLANVQPGDRPADQHPLGFRRAL
jgi:hypothetical protein